MEFLVHLGCGIWALASKMLSNQNHNEQTDINTVVGCIVRGIVIGCLLSEITLVSGCCELAVQMYT